MHESKNQASDYHEAEYLEERRRSDGGLARKKRELEGGKKKRLKSIPERRSVMGFGRVVRPRCGCSELFCRPSVSTALSRLPGNSRLKMPRNLGRLWESPVRSSTSARAADRAATCLQGRLTRAARQGRSDAAAYERVKHQGRGAAAAFPTERPGRAGGVGQRSWRASGVDHAGMRWFSIRQAHSLFTQNCNTLRIIWKEELFFFCSFPVRICRM